MKKLLLAALVSAASAVSAHAASTSCSGKIVIEGVHQVGNSQGGFDYFVQVRNSTNAQITTDISFGGFPSLVSLFNPNMANTPLHANESKRIKFGSGTAQVHDATVRKLYDSRGVGSSWVAATNCKQ